MGLLFAGQCGWGADGSVAGLPSEGPPGGVVKSITTTATPEEGILAIVDYFDTFEVVDQQAETTVRGYKVRVTREQFSPEDASERRTLIARTIARSLNKKSTR